MDKLSNILENVDSSLLKLIEANDAFSSYKKITLSSTTTCSVGLIQGSLGIAIDAKKPIGITITGRV